MGPTINSILSTNSAGSSIQENFLEWAERAGYAFLGFKMFSLCVKGFE